VTPPPAGGRSLSIMAILVSDPANVLSGAQPSAVAVLRLFAIVPQKQAGVSKPAREPTKLLCAYVNKRYV
jgi:hypothetical protein